MSFTADAPVGEIEESGVAFAEGNSRFKAAVGKALADLQKEGSFAKLFNQWFDRDVSKLPTAN